MNEIVQPLKSMTSDPAFAGLKIIDVDTHWSEPPDLWTSRAPASLKNKVPRIIQKDNERQWVIGEEAAKIAKASPAAVIDKRGKKIYGGDFLASTYEQVHAACLDLTERLMFLDRLGIHAQVLYPNIAGLAAVYNPTKDRALNKWLTATYNTVAAEEQEKTKHRIMPMAILPSWDVQDAVEELERCVKLGFHGVVASGDVQTMGMPALGQEYWYPLWEACEHYAVPINFHIGQSAIAMSVLERSAWPYFGPEAWLAIASSSLYIDNARIIGNIIYSCLLERFPKLQFVSVESGIGWLPFYLEALDYQLVETAPSEAKKMTMKPSEYFRRNFYASFWFESGLGKGLAATIDAIGEDRIMFETDFPHPTCLYPGPLEFAKRSIGPLDKRIRKKLLQDNAAKLYKVDLAAA